jgi:hypothetical protein
MLCYAALIWKTDSNAQIASGLYYLSELVEEHSVFSKRLLARLIYIITAIHVLLWVVDSFPFKLTLLAVLSHVVYLQNLRSFPVVNLTNPFFLASCSKLQPYECSLCPTILTERSSCPGKPLVLLLTLSKTAFPSLLRAVRALWCNRSIHNADIQ